MRIPSLNLRSAFVISLARRKERLEAFWKNLPSSLARRDIEWLEAVDGQVARGTQTASELLQGTGGALKQTRVLRVRRAAARRAAAALLEEDL